MLPKFNDKSTSKVFGSIAAAQTMVEHYPIFVGKTENGYTCSFDLLTTLFNLISDESLPDMIIKWLTEKMGDTNCTWLQGIEETIKLALEANITNLLTCEINPIIPDKLIGGGIFLEGGDHSFPFNSEGIRIPVSAIDFTGLLEHNPADESSVAARSNYIPCYKSNSPDPENPELLSANELWKHDDFNAFLWYVKNKGVYANVQERQKLTWDNRYKSRPYTKYERKPETFFTKTKGEYGYNGENGVVPFDGVYLKKYNENRKNRDKKKQILECSYSEGDGMNNDYFCFRLAASNYYKTRKINKNKDGAKILAFNKTIFEFNHDFLMSLQLFDIKTYLMQVTQNTFGKGFLNVSFSLQRNNEVEELIDTAINNVIINDDNDLGGDGTNGANGGTCAFSFSNEDYQIASNKALYKMEQSAQNQSEIESYLTTIENYDKVDDTEKEEVESQNKNEEIIETILVSAKNQVEKNQELSTRGNGGFVFDYNYEFEIIRMFVYPLIKPLFSPKVITLFLINTYVMGNPLEIGNKIINFETLKPFLNNILVSVIKQIKDIILEMIYSFIIEKITPLLTIFSLRLVLEQIEAYRELILNLMEALLKIRINGNNGTQIDDVRYADIDPLLEEQKKTPISQNNC